MADKSLFIGIAGGTGSGKTSIAKAITAEFGKSEVALIEQDSYYKDLSHQPMEIRKKTNFDHPDAVDFQLIKSQMLNLLNWQSVKVPIYDFSTH